MAASVRPPWRPGYRRWSGRDSCRPPRRYLGFAMLGKQQVQGLRHHVLDLALLLGGERLELRANVGRCTVIGAVPSREGWGIADGRSTAGIARLIHVPAAAASSPDVWAARGQHAIVHR